MKRKPIKRSSPEQIREWKRTSKPLSRSGRIKPIGRGKRRQVREGTSYGPLADFVRQIGECQARGKLPGDCGWLPGRRKLEVCHAGSKNSGQYDWVTDPDGETVGNLLLACPSHHDWMDDHKARYLDWMRETARENGERYEEATDG